MHIYGLALYAGKHQKTYMSAWNLYSESNNSIDNIEQLYPSVNLQTACFAFHFIHKKRKAF